MPFTASDPASAQTGTKMMNSQYTTSKTDVFALGSAIALVVGFFLPWITVSVLGLSVSGWDLISLANSLNSMNPNAQGSAPGVLWLWLILIAGLCGLATSIWGLASSHSRRTASICSLIAGLAALAPFALILIHVLGQTRQPAMSQSSMNMSVNVMSLIGVGVWSTLLGAIGLIMQVFLPRPTVHTYWQPAVHNSPPLLNGSPAAPPAEIPTARSVYLTTTWPTDRGGWVGDQSWKALGGLLVNDGTSNDSSHWIVAPVPPSTPDYAVEAEIQVAWTGGTGCDQGFGLVARSGYRASVNYHWTNSGGTTAHLSTMNTCSVLGHQNFDPGAARYSSDGWHTYRLEVQRNTLRFLIDGNTILSALDNRSLTSGQVGLWSMNTQIDVRRFEVIQFEPLPPPTPSRWLTTSVYLANWTSGLNSWVGDQSWKVVAGMLVNDGSNGDSSHWIVAPVAPPLPDYAVEAEIQVVRTAGTGRDHGFGLVARSGYRAGVIYNRTDSGGTTAHLSTMNTYDGLGDRNFDPGAARHPHDRWHTYRLEVQGNTLRLLINRSVMVVTTDNQFASAGKVGLWSANTQIDVRRFEVIKL
jgi:Domain of Unknown Function (DUF1080)